MSSGPLIQYSLFPASEGLFDDDSRFKETLEILRKADGYISSYQGLQVQEEGGKNGYFISVWESVEHHKKFREGNLHKKIFGSLKQTAADQLVPRQFVPIKGNPLPALESKNTEVVIITPKPGASAAKVKEIGIRLRDLWDGEGHTTTFSQNVDEEGVFLMLVGWDSTSHHLETVKKDPYASLVNEFAQIGDFDLTHANLKKHA
ncbi:hypothetical protein D9757_005555 [Collybiopsis confluens]|uniref:ABM domain-containing protein n=1 Tax=Collybiopsis confluens TaxID=2823264 RepID=A0A8H5HM22_9AGAR|nr:hypothetical protein D9757_005555 [Collybiopsis confluens]